jgi:hypothetical protein
MKIQQLTLALLLAPSFLFAAEKPDGVIGSDFVGLTYSYYSDDYGYYDGGEETFNGYGVVVNKNVIDGSKIGADAYLRLYHVGALENDNLYDYSQNTIAAGGTVFLKGMISPFVGGTLYCHFIDLDYTDSAAADESETDWVLCGRIGVEIHFLPGFSGTLAIGEAHDFESDGSSNETIYELGVAYWFSRRIGVSANESYANYSHIDELSTSITLMYHF